MDRLITSPEPFIETCRSLARAKSIYLDVADGHVRLGWMGGSEDEFMDRVELIRLDISYEMLLDALEEAGGTTSMGGCYPINYAIRQRLTNLFKNQMSKYTSV